VIPENCGAKIMKISDIISVWYKKNKRVLPWRENSDPYSIWLSEIILQQTRVNQGLAYYKSFIEKYPDVHMLAEANEQDVMKLWQGLGYYSRARNLLYAARQVRDEYNGVFPTAYNDLIKLKGVGPYTAAAVASISSNEAVPVVDGNVIRVLSRIFGVEEEVNTGKGQQEIQRLAWEILDRQHAGEHNQALMEFGALQCVPGMPDCMNCPLQSLCEANRSGSQTRLPRKKSGPAVKERYFYYLVLTSAGYTYIYKRTKEDIWKHLFEFPLIESSTPLTDSQLMKKVGEMPGIGGEKFTLRSISPEVRHQLSHRTIHARFMRIELKGDNIALPGEWIRIAVSSLSDYPVPRLIDRYLEETDITSYN